MKKDHVDPVQILKTGLNMSEVAQLKKAAVQGKSAADIARHFRVEVKLVQSFLTYYKEDIDILKKEAEARNESASIPKAKQNVLEGRITELENANKVLIKKRDELVKSNKDFATANKGLGEADAAKGQEILDLKAELETFQANFMQYKADVEKAEAVEATAKAAESKTEVKDK